MNIGEKRKAKKCSAPNRSFSVPPHFIFKGLFFLVNPATHRGQSEAMCQFDSRIHHKHSYSTTCMFSQTFPENLIHLGQRNMNDWISSKCFGESRHGVHESAPTICFDAPSHADALVKTSTFVSFWATCLLERLYNSRASLKLHIMMVGSPVLGVP